MCIRDSYWNNHHHMLYVTERVTGGVLWANMHLLFWLSLIPFATGWMGEGGFAHTPTAVYGAVLLMAAIAYYVLQCVIVRSQGEGSLLARAVGRDLKGKSSLVLYVIAIPAAFLQPWVAYAIYALVALVWVIPDTRIARAVTAREAARAEEQVSPAGPHIAEEARDARRRPRAVGDAQGEAD